MIDKVKLTLIQNYDISLFEKNNFNYKTSKQHKSKYYFKTIKNVSVLYFTEKNMLMISGRIIYLYNDKIGKVKNFDDVIIIEKVTIDYILKIIEENLMKLFFPNQDITPLVRLDQFNVSYIEYCININVGTQFLVDSYIKMMNLMFIEKKDKRYKNFVLESNQELNTSSYIKSNGKYKMNSKTGTTINFYNKFNQLSKQNSNRWKNRSKILHKKSIEESIGILRMEVQYGSQILYQFRKNHGLMLFKDYKDIDFAYTLICSKYSYLYRSGKFFSYEEIQKIISSSTNLSDNEILNTINACLKYSKRLGQEYVERKGHNHKFSDHYKRRINNLGANPVLIPTKFGLPMLECPIKLINKKRESLKRIINYD